MTDEYVCETCGKSYKSRSGLWKHQKKLGHGKFESVKIGEGEVDSNTNNDPSQTSVGTDTSKSPVGSEDSPNPSSDAPPAPTGDTTYDWMDFDFGTSEATETIPAPLKSIVRPMPGDGSKLSKAQLKVLEQQNKGILKMGLTTVDTLLTAYGKAVSLDETFEVRHTESDKDLVANAQYAYMEEKGFFLTNYLSTGMIAGSLTVWYVGAPLLRIRKNAKKKLIRGRLFSRLPLIGRFFKKKEEPSDIGQTVMIDD